MSDATIQTLFRSLEHTIRERLDGIQEVMVSRFTNSVNYANSANSINSANYIPSVPYYSGANVNYIPGQESALISRIISLEASVQLMRNELNTLRELTQSTDRDLHRDQARDILPLNPIDGIEVIPKREVVLETDTEPLSYADRLLLNKKARKALEAEEMGEADKYPLNPEEDDEDEAAEAAEEEVAEEEVAEEDEGDAAVEDEGEAAEEEEAAVEDEGEAAEEEEAEELEEFLYKGSTYYRDSENNVFTTDEDGELVDTPVGKWNAERKRIVVSTA